MAGQGLLKSTSIVRLTGDVVSEVCGPTSPPKKGAGKPMAFCIFLLRLLLRIDPRSIEW